MGKASSARRARRSGQPNRYKLPYVWGGGVDLDFSREEWAELCRFQEAVNSAGGEPLSLEKICKQAVFMTIQESYRRAHAMAEEERTRGGESGAGAPTGVSDGRTVHGDVAQNTEQAPAGEDTNSSALAESQDPAPAGG